MLLWPLLYSPMQLAMRHTGTMAGMEPAACISAMPAMSAGSAMPAMPTAPAMPAGSAMSAGSAVPTAPAMPDTPKVQTGGAYAQLVKTATQSFTAPVDGVVTFNEQSKTDNIIVSNGAITFLTPGTYKLEYNLNVQDVQAGAASTGNVSIYLRSLGTPINGTQVTFPLTNTDVEVISGGRLSPCPRTMYSIAL